MAEDFETLRNLIADLQRWVHRLHWILVDHGRLGGPELTQLRIGHLGDVLAVSQDVAFGDSAVGWHVAKGRVRGGGLAATGFANETEGLSGANLERHAPQHLTGLAANQIGEVEVLNRQGRRVGIGPVYRVSFCSIIVMT